MDTLTSPDVTSFEELTSDIVPQCEVGHPNGTRGSDDNKGPCPDPADYSVRYHDCENGERGHTRVGLWCQDHLDQALVSVSAVIAAADSRSRSAHCIHCLMQVRAIEDYVWDVTPLK